MEFPLLSEQGKNFLLMAKSRDETVSEGVGYKNGKKLDPCGKDTKAFWFLLGYWTGESNKIMEFKQKRKRSKK